ncbi:Uu.00g129300.m01.CDS01 [Anthostomella pinea]|uniref:Uu.00g129300.m01.CDS01 n=1 Tax=Anthostomella pinea TaxID=933095 RepID=A0AAI8YI30_9PEZI|nr:Uu.00g129300.m01.CDS01 [Anthostomella pinea]
MSFIYSMNFGTENSPNKGQSNDSADFTRPPTAQGDNAGADNERPAEPASTKRLSVSKSDMSQLLVHLNDRLEQAEARLAFGSPTLNTQQNHAAWPELGLLTSPSSATVASGSGFGHHGHEQVQLLPSGTNLPITSGNTILLESHGPKIECGEASSEMRMDSTSTDIPSDYLVDPSATGSWDMDTTLQEYSFNSYSEAESDTTLVIPSAVLSKLHSSFFDVFHPVTPIIDRSRFQAKLACEPVPIQTQALSLAMGTLGALATPELDFALDACYLQARNLLNQCEMQESDAPLADINTLQACILLSLYEFRQNLSRAWITLGRAMRLGQIMCLDRTHATRNSAHPGPFTPLPPVSDPGELEERRRAFWQLYILDGFASMRTNSTPTFDGREVSLPLPCPGNLATISEPHEMPPLGQVFDLSRDVKVSFFAGTAIMVAMYRRCFDHIYTWAHVPSYPFWDTHYGIDSLIAHSRENLLEQYCELDGNSTDRPLCIILRMNMAAVEINLHETAIAKVNNEHLPSSLATEAMTKCESGARDIEDAVRAGQRLRGRDLATFQHASPLFTWPMTKAMQAYLWVLHHRKDNINTCINGLRTLAASARELIDSDQLVPELLEQIDARLAEADRSKKRRYAPGLSSF